MKNSRLSASLAKRLHKLVCLLGGTGVYYIDRHNMRHPVEDIELCGDTWCMSLANGDQVPLADGRSLIVKGSSSSSYAVVLHGLAAAMGAETIIKFGRSPSTSKRYTLD